LSSAVTEPTPLDPNWPRYSSYPFPAYRFVPGQTPHPRRNPLGHSYAQREPCPKTFPATQWHTSADYLYGIDLYNFAYWWESHEVFEGLWHAVGHNSEQGNFFQALIQLAAANLKGFSGNDQAAENLLRRGLIRLQKVPGFYMGLDVAQLVEDLQQRIIRSQWQAPSLRLCI
jgi:predicted metal-dependent hydrolase